MELSKRLKAVAGLVTEGASVADIGTDHGYVPIWLIRTGRAARVIAMDINEGPLERARAHIRSEGLERMIHTRRSDGLHGLHPGEADTMIAAGMGGGLVIRILDESPEIAADMKEFILQPQSEIHRVRAYLAAHDFRCVEERMIEEDGKYYPMMKLVHGEEEELSREELYYGRLLLREKDPVLYQFLQRECALKTDIADRLAGQQGGGAESRRRELAEELACIERAIASYR